MWGLCWVAEQTQLGLNSVKKNILLRKNPERTMDVLTTAFVLSLLILREFQGTISSLQLILLISIPIRY